MKNPVKNYILYSVHISMPCAAFSVWFPFNSPLIPNFRTTVRCNCTYNHNLPLIKGEPNQKCQFKKGVSLSSLHPPIAPPPHPQPSHTKGLAGLNIMPQQSITCLFHPPTHPQYFNLNNMKLQENKKKRLILLTYPDWCNYCAFQWDQPSLVVVVYDVTDETSFSSCTKWLERVRAVTPNVTIPGQSGAFRGCISLFFLFQLAKGKFPNSVKSPRRAYYDWEIYQTKLV